MACVLKKSALVIFLYIIASLSVLGIEPVISFLHFLSLLPLSHSGNPLPQFITQRSKLERLSLSVTITQL